MFDPRLGLAWVLLSFLVGAVPWGYLAGRFARGIDLRTVGSGGTGATNVLRTLGPGASAIVFTLDFLKGLLPVLLARTFDLQPGWTAVVAVAAVAGHCWSPFIGFKGGKGVATGAGAAIALMPGILVILPIVVAIIWKTRFVSLGSLTAAILATIVACGAAMLGLIDWPSAAAISAIAGIIVIRHRENIQRLRAGAERRFGERVAL